MWLPLLNVFIVPLLWIVYDMRKEIKDSRRDIKKVVFQLHIHAEVITQMQTVCALRHPGAQQPPALLSHLGKPTER